MLNSAKKPKIQQDYGLKNVFQAISNFVASPQSPSFYFNFENCSAKNYVYKTSINLFISLMPKLYPFITKYKLIDKNYFQLK